jgi:hypothetical protein
LKKSGVLIEGEDRRLEMQTHRYRDPHDELFGSFNDEEDEEDDSCGIDEDGLYHYHPALELGLLTPLLDSDDDALGPEELDLLDNDDDDGFGLPVSGGTPYSQ